MVRWLQEERTAFLKVSEVTPAAAATDDTGLCPAPPPLRGELAYEQQDALTANGAVYLSCPGAPHAGALSPRDVMLTLIEQQAGWPDAPGEDGVWD